MSLFNPRNMTMLSRVAARSCNLAPFRCPCGHIIPSALQHRTVVTARLRFSQTTPQVGTSSSAIDAAVLHPLDVSRPPPPAVVATHNSPKISQPKSDVTSPRKQEPPAAKPARREIKAAKAAITMTPTAVEQLRGLLDSPTPKLIRIGVRNKGCAGMSYHLEYVDKPGRFDEVVEQEGIKVLIDSKALFSIVGSVMDWVEDKISAKFVFNNPNIKEQCGCGESFLT